MKIVYKIYIIFKINNTFFFFFFAILSTRPISRCCPAKCSLEGGNPSTKPVFAILISLYN